jgi:hypothetical protein
MKENPDKDELLALCQKFITDQKIGCEETVYSERCVRCAFRFCAKSGSICGDCAFNPSAPVTNRVIENAHEFIEEICEIVGYAEEEEEEEDE